MPYELVYASRISPGLDPSFVSGIVLRSRIKNRRLGISGLLVFDGNRFCQLLEGEKPEVLLLAGTIMRDHRHHDFQTLHQGEHGGHLRFEGSHMAFGLHEGNRLSHVIERSTGLEMAEYLQNTSTSLGLYGTESAEPRSAAGKQK